MEMDFLKEEEKRVYATWIRDIHNLKGKIFYRSKIHLWKFKLKLSQVPHLHNVIVERILIGDPRFTDRIFRQEDRD